MRWSSEDNLGKNCGGRNEEDEPQLGHHPEAGQGQTGVEELCYPLLPAGMMGSDDDDDDSDMSVLLLIPVMVLYCDRGFPGRTSVARSHGGSRSI